MHSMSTASRPLLAASVAAALCLGAAGCGGGGTTAPAPTQPTTGETEPATTFAVYLLEGEKVAPVRRRVAQTAGVARAALTALLAGPTAQETDAGYGTSIPQGSRFRGVSITGGTATVDLTSSFATGGGSASMLTRVAQVVYTATQFPGVVRVAFRLDGAPAEAIGGEGVIVDPPVTRADFEDQTPAILVESPLPGDTVRSPVRIHGTANVFEANVGLEVRRADGTVLRRTFVTAASGTGTRGTFETEVPVEAPAGPFTLVAFAPSARDGSPQFPVVLRLILER